MSSSHFLTSGIKVFDQSREKLEKFEQLVATRNYQEAIELFMTVMNAVPLAELRLVVGQLIRNALQSNRSDFLIPLYINQPVEFEACISQNHKIRNELINFLCVPGEYKPNIELINTILNPADREHVIAKILDNAIDFNQVGLLPIVYENHPAEFQKFIDQNASRRKEILDFISHVNNYRDNNCLINQVLTQAEREIVLTDLISHFVNKFDVEALDVMKKNHPKDFAVCAANLDSGLKKIFDVIQAHPVDTRSNCKDKMRIMKEFVNGTGYVSYQGCLLTCAQINERKKGRYHFNPTVLNTHVQFKEYLNCIQDSPAPLTERFIISDKHWISGEIKKNEKNEVEVLFIDSGGSKYFEYKSLINDIDALFPNAKIHLARTSRQLGAAAGCSIYAIKDATRLYTTEKYIGKTIFDYFADQLAAKENYEIKFMSDYPQSNWGRYYLYEEQMEPKLNHLYMEYKNDEIRYSMLNRKELPLSGRIHKSELIQNMGEARAAALIDALGHQDPKTQDFAAEIVEILKKRQHFHAPGLRYQQPVLPLSFMHSMRSQKLYTEIIPNRPLQEQKQVVNKKGEIALVAAKKYFIVDEKKKKEQNRRVEHDLEQIAKHNAEYLLTHPSEEINIKKQEFTLEGFQKRMKAKQLELKSEASFTPKSK
jgi:hypothetical protein